MVLQSLDFVVKIVNRFSLKRSSKQNGSNFQFLTIWLSTKKTLISNLFIITVNNFSQTKYGQTGQDINIPTYN